MGCLLIVNVVEGRPRFCTMAAAPRSSGFHGRSRPLIFAVVAPPPLALFLAAIMDWEIAASCDDEDHDRDTKLPHRFLLRYGYEHDWLFL